MTPGIRHFVEPAFGWLFVAVVLVVVGAALLTARAPTLEMTGRIEVHRAH